MKEATRTQVIMDALFNEGHEGISIDRKENKLTTDEGVSMEYSKIRVRRVSHFNVGVFYEGELIGRVWWEKGHIYESE